MDGKREVYDWDLEVKQLIDYVMRMERINVWMKRKKDKKVWVKYSKCFQKVQNIFRKQTSKKNYLKLGKRRDNN